jgi:hypothetical protein
VIVAKPRPKRKTSAIATRLAPVDRDRIRALAEAEGLTLQQLGEYAWSRALIDYGRPPL